MAKTIDYIALRFAIFMLLLIWFNYLINSFFLAGLLSIILFSVICTIIEWVKSRTKSSTYSLDKFNKHLSLMGSAYTLNLYAKTNKLDVDLIKNNTLINDKTKIISLFRYSDIGIEDIASTFRNAFENDIETIKIICKGVSRDALNLAETLPIKYEFIKGNLLYKQLKITNTLPTLITIEKTKLKNFSIKNFLDIILSTANTKHYIFSGAILGIMSFIVPMKLYYILVSTFSFLTALLTLIYPKIREKMNL